MFILRASETRASMSNKLSAKHSGYLAIIYMLLAVLILLIGFSKS